MRKIVDILKRTKEGREALFDTIHQYGGFTSTGANDPLEQARLVARRQVATDIMQALLTDSMDSFTVMMSEHYIRSQGKQGEEKNDDN
jgi:hypothetical protein